MTSSGSGFVTVAESPAIRLYYESTSPTPLPDKPVLVFSHSLSAATWLWDAAAKEFSNTHTVIRYDIRFHGQSPLPPQTPTGGLDLTASHTIEDLASDVVKLLDHLNIKKADAFIGLSIGGGIATVLAAQHADRFRNIIAVGSRASSSPADQQVWDDRVALAREKGMLALSKQSVSRWFPAEWLDQHPVLAAEFAERVGRQTLEGYIANIAALTKLQLIPHADTIRHDGHGEKILFVVGENDAPIVVEETKELAERAGSRWEVIAKAGHITHVEQPEAFYAIIRQVLQ